MIRIFNNLEGLSLASAEMFANLANQAIASRGRFCVALSGGNTPRRLHEILANTPIRDQIRWESVYVFWGDERCVPADDPSSNALMARQTLLITFPYQPVTSTPFKAIYLQHWPRPNTKPNYGNSLGTRHRSLT